METKAIYAQLLLDEGSRVLLTPRDPVSVVGSLVLIDESRKTVRSEIECRRIPKWRDATPADSDVVVGLFERTRAYARIDVFAKPADAVAKLRAHLERDQAEERRTLDELERVSGERIEYESTPDGLFHFMLFASVAE